MLRTISSESRIYQQQQQKQQQEQQSMYDDTSSNHCDDDESTIATTTTVTRKMILQDSGFMQRSFLSIDTQTSVSDCKLDLLRFDNNSSNYRIENQDDKRNRNDYDNDDSKNNDNNKNCCSKYCDDCVPYDEYCFEDVKLDNSYNDNSIDGIFYLRNVTINNKLNQHNMDNNNNNDNDNDEIYNTDLERIFYKYVGILVDSMSPCCNMTTTNVTATTNTIVNASNYWMDNNSINNSSSNNTNTYNPFYE